MCKPIRTDTTAFIHEDLKVVTSINRASSSYVVRIGEEYGSSYSLFFHNFQQMEGVFNALCQRIAYLKAEIAREEEETANANDALV